MSSPPRVDVDDSIIHESDVELDVSEAEVSAGSDITSVGDNSDSLKLSDDEEIDDCKTAVQDRSIINEALETSQSLLDEELQEEVRNISKNEEGSSSEAEKNEGVAGVDILGVSLVEVSPHEVTVASVDCSMDKGENMHPNAVSTESTGHGYPCSVASFSSEDMSNSRNGQEFGGDSFCADDSDSLCWSDESSSEDKSEDNDFPLYEDSPISLNNCLIAILVFAIRYSLTSKCLSDLLKLIFYICRPLQCKMKSTHYQFWKHFSNLKAPITFHYFCSDCLQPLSEAKAKCPFEGNHSNKTTVSYFLELPLVDQIKALFARKNFKESLTHRFNRVKLNAENLEDIWDGQLYKEQVESGFLSPDNPYNFSLLGNSDGVPVYHSSNTSLYPVFFSICELPFSERFSQENMLLGGVWYGPQKPVGNLLLGTFRESLINLYKGVSVKFYNATSSVIAKGKLLFFTCDLPAKCMFMGMTQFNGEYGCHVCKQKGESVQIVPSKKRKRSVNESENVKKSSVWVYKYCENIELRSHSETVAFGRQAQSQREKNPDAKRINVFGVLNPSALSKLMPDFIRGMAIDVMHCLFLGVVKKLASLWFTSKYSNEPFSLSKYMSVIDKRFLNICPPNFVQRNVRSIETHMKHWKASEWRNFFFYYSIPLLDGVLPAVYFENYIDLVVCMSELHSTSISPAQILSCATRLSKFVKTFETLYGPRHMTINMHLMLHITLIVNNLGPLWAYTCAPFENMNGLILKIVSGTRHVQTQLANCAYIVLQLPFLLESICDTNVRQYCYDLVHPSLKLKAVENVSDNCFTVGTYRVSNVPTGFKEAFKQAGFIVSKYQTFMKLKKGRFLYVCESYKRQTKNESSFISFLSQGEKKIGQIVSFHRISSCNCNVTCLCKPAWFVALIKLKNVEPFISASPGATCPTLIYREIPNTNEELAVINVNSLVSMLFCVRMPRKCFICEPVNMLEAEL